MLAEFLPPQIIKSFIKILLISFLSLHTLFLLEASVQAKPVSKKAQEKLFQLWISDIKKEALSNGISSSILKNAFKNVKLNWKLPDLDIKTKKKAKPKKRQPEFASPGRYFPKKILAYTDVAKQSTI